MIELEEFKTAVFSTGHITQEDNNLFMQTGDRDGIVIEQVEFGYRLYIGGSDGSPVDTEDIVNYLRQAKFSEHVVTIAKLAGEAGAKWVLFDCDGTEYDELPKFDW